MFANILKHVVSNGEDLAALHPQPGLLERLSLSTLEEVLPMLKMAAWERPFSYLRYKMLTRRVCAEATDKCKAEA